MTGGQLGRFWMKIGVLSDTHLEKPHSEFKKFIEFHFKDVDQIFHAGDFISWEVTEYLSSLKQLVAVSGNMDPSDIRKAFPQQRVIEACGFRIGLVHGGGAPFGIESRVREQFDEVDMIVYGHTHMPANHRTKKILFFNPGSLTRSFVGKGTIGILRIGEKIEGEIIKI